MIQKIVDAWMSNEASARAAFAAKHPEEYKDIVRVVVETLCLTMGKYNRPDPERIHEIDDGDYQGTLVYVIAEAGGQPSRYWYARVGYGSCSGCDTLQSLRGWEDGPPTPKQVNGYMTLALHIVQGMREMGGGVVG
jgi:hypothetical protein